MKKIFLILSVLAGTLTIYGKTLEIVKDGRSDYCIVVNRKGPPCILNAAHDLQEYIRKATGACLPITGEQNGRPAFMLGFLPVDKPESFVVRTMGNDIYISGYDTEGAIFEPHLAEGAHVGTWYGVCDFLEKQLGVRWFMPGELGEYVPKRDKWSIEELNYSESPRMELRIMQYVIPYPIGNTAEKNIREGQLWLRRNRHGNVEPWCGWHSWRHDFPAGKYFAEHPDWFALVKGRRCNDDPGGYGVKMCTTNPKALDQYAKNLIDSRKGWKHPWMLSLTPNDSGNFCECANCISLDDGLRPDGSRIMTTRIMTYANEVAHRVKQELPGQKFGINAYAFYYEAVSGIRLDPSITVMEVLNDTGIGYYDSARRVAHLKNLKAWRKVLSKLYYYCTPEGMTGLELPCHQYGNIKLLFDDLYAADVSGILMNNPTGFSASGLNNYLYLKFAWGVSEPEKLYLDALRDCYGSIGATVMRTYTADIEKRMAGFAAETMEEDIALGYIKRYPRIFKKVYEGLAEKWLPELRMAMEKTKDHGQKARLQIVIDNLEYCKATVELYNIACTLIASSVPDPKLLAVADNLAVRREEILKKQGNPPANVYGKTDSVIKNNRFAKLPDRNMLKYMMAAQSRKYITAERYGTPPVLDGKLNESFWENILPQRIELDSKAMKLKVGADIRVAIVGNDLYIGIHCEEPFVSKIADIGRSCDSPVWEENCIDLFIAPPNKEKKYYQLVFNSLGTVRSFLYASKSMKWEAKEEIRTFRGSNFWSAEVKLPFASMTDKTELRGDIWGINFCRVRKTVVPAESTCWSPTFGSFHQPERFGKLVII